MKTKIQFFEKKLTEKQFTAKAHYLYLTDTENKAMPFYNLVLAKLNRNQKNSMNYPKAQCNWICPTAA